MKKISIIFGTRPEAIKLCPLVLELWKHPEFEPHVCVTGQHRQMLDQVLDVFDVAPDVDLNLMQPDQTLAGLTARAITAIDGYLVDYKPDMVIVQGDTTTAFCAALAAFYRHIAIGHVEAGLRTWNKLSPFPEEINRVMTSRIADLHFAPTQWAKNNLLKEGVPEERVLV
ncbi:MAG: UDP-N-acetylglucosamine 2-epimerase (non-hydrolyzing), partial [Phycisphaerales bacterium]